MRWKPRDTPGFITLRSERGATMIEYALMVSLIAMVAVGAVTAVGLKVFGLFDGLATFMGTL